MKDIFYKVLWFMLGILIGMVIISTSDKDIMQIENKMKSFFNAAKEFFRAIF
jgi:hypothetical protein